MQSGYKDMFISLLHPSDASARVIRALVVRRAFEAPSPDHPDELPGVKRWSCRPDFAIEGSSSSYTRSADAA
jgi:hypothetical protein